MSFSPLPIIITVAGLYLLIKLRFFFILHPVRSFGRALRTLRRPGKLGSFTLALAGTLGVGNVFGVCVGIIVGGAGSVFWLLVSTLFSSVLKYAEVLLSSDNKSHEGGGMFYTVRNTYKRIGHPLSLIYAALCLLLAFVMGAALQSSTVISTSDGIFDTPPYITALLMSLLVAASVLGGGRIIGKITLIIIPLTTIIYITLAAGIILPNLYRIGDILSLILHSAVAPKAGVGGVLGFLLGAPFREGYSRGILSNEAGAGTSTLAHATSADDEPATAGLLGILEVFFDTALLCMLTALAVLLAIPNPDAYDSGMSLIIDAFSSGFGSTAAYLLLFCVFAFAYSTVICWYYYGNECVRQLFGGEYKLLYFPVFLAFMLFGYLINESTLVLLSDLLLLLLTVITVPTLIKNSDRLLYLSESSGILKIKGSVSSRGERHR